MFPFKASFTMDFPAMFDDTMFDDKHEIQHDLTARVAGRLNEGNLCRGAPWHRAPSGAGNLVAQLGEHWQWGAMFASRWTSEPAETDELKLLTFGREQLPVRDAGAIKSSGYL